MKDKGLVFPGIDIFKGSSASAYVEYCDQPQMPWSFLERPMWKIIIREHLESQELPRAQILDVGTGTGKLYQLLIESGAKPENMLALEPNDELARYLGSVKHVPCIWGSSHDMGHYLLQAGETDLVTANMVMNHLTTGEYDEFVGFAKGVLMENGVLIYTTPFPEEKANKHGFDVNDNSVVIEEAAPWGGLVNYNHRSQKYQAEKLQENGFKVERFMFGYDDFSRKETVSAMEMKYSKSFRGPKRLMFVGVKL